MPHGRGRKALALCFSEAFRCVSFLDPLPTMAHVWRAVRHWRVRQTGLPTVLVFASEDDLFSVVIDFSDSLEDRSDAELQRLLDEGRGEA